MPRPPLVPFITARVPGGVFWSQGAMGMGLRLEDRVCLFACVCACVLVPQVGRATPPWATHPRRPTLGDPPWAAHPGRPTHPGGPPWATQPWRPAPSFLSPLAGVRYSYNLVTKLLRTIVLTMDKSPRLKNSVLVFVFCRACLTRQRVRGTRFGVIVVLIVSAVCPS